MGRAKNGTIQLCMFSLRENHEENKSIEGVDFVFETDDEDEWYICVECKNKFDDKNNY